MNEVGLTAVVVAYQNIADKWAKLAEESSSTTVSASLSGSPSIAPWTEVV